MAHLVHLQQPLPPNASLAEQHMPRAAIQPLPLLEQRLVIEGCLVAGKVADGVIQPLFQQQPLKLCRRCTDQLQLH
ncbi:hypothetical protein D3C77_757400 [compost metagenome]